MSLLDRKEESKKEDEKSLPKEKALSLEARVAKIEKALREHGSKGPVAFHEI